MSTFDPSLPLTASAAGLLESSIGLDDGADDINIVTV